MGFLDLFHAAESPQDEADTHPQSGFILRVEAQLNRMTPTQVADYMSWLESKGWVTDLRTLEL